MTTTLPFGTSDADAAAMAGLVSRSHGLRANRNAAEAAEIRLLAEAGRLALRQARARSAKAREMALRSIAAELATAANDSDRAMRAQIDRAMTFVDDYPATFAAFEQGRILRRHLDVVRDCGTPLDPEARALFDQTAAVRCESDSPNRARAVLERLAENLQPRSLTERHQHARQSRRVQVIPLGDGMAELIATLPVTLAHAIHDRLTRQAKAVRDIRERAKGAVPPNDGLLDVVDSDGGPTPDDPDAERELSPAEIIASDERTCDQIRADLLADMLLTGTPDTDPAVTGDGPGELGAIRAVVQVTVPVLSLLGRGEEAADLAGAGPIDAATARGLAGGCPGLDRILTHPITGAVLATDRYQPTTDIRRFLRARDHRCRFPGCRMPAIRCDVDHTHDYAYGGATAACNLEHLCRGHHSLKHATPWKVRQLADGVLEWTSPVGHTYTDHPPGAVIPGATAASLTARPPVTFVPDGDPPPF